MKCLLVAAALLLGFYGTSFAHTSMAKSKPHHHHGMSMSKKTMQKNNCHIVGADLICK
jgi:hypothetical protein